MRSNYPLLENAFSADYGNEKYIETWIKDGEIPSELEEFFEWLDIEYKLKIKNLNQADQQLAEEVKRPRT